nr:unnamed protein product [Callosobruchus chinensis]
MQTIWCRWSKEYINELQVRSKWRQNYPNLLKQGAVVLLKEDNLPPLKWSLGRIIELHPGKDGVTRVVSVKTSGGVLKRPVMKYPGGEKWYISNVELTVSPDLPQLRGIPVKDKSAIRLYHRTILIPTPVGKAFECDELDVDLEPAPDDKSTPPGVRGSLLLRLIKIQPFMYKGEDFSTAVHCRKGQSSFRDETTSIAVGSTLAVAVIAILIGYSAYKYFRVKNVQYNTME